MTSCVSQSNGKFELTCVLCSKVQTEAYSPRCEYCDGLTEPLYSLDNVTLADSSNPYTRFFELLPIHDRSLLPAQASYTPTVHALNLGRKLKMSRLYLKNETAQPTGTTKYRMAAVALAYLYECGVRHFCTSSTGNSSSAYACQISNIPDMKMSLFTGSEFRDRVNYPPSKQVIHYVLDGMSFADAFVHASSFANQYGYTAERGFFNPGRREGLKLAWLEACDQVQEGFDWYVQAVSSAMGVYGTYKGAKELLKLGKIDRLPQLLCVQQESCAPMVNAWREGAERIESRHKIQNPKGIAKAILRGDPTGVYPYMKETVEHSHGEFTSVSNEEIITAQRLVADLEGISICYAASAAVAGLIKMRAQGRVGRQDRVLINLTGSDRER